MQYQNYIDSINNYIKKNNTKKALEYSQLLINEFPKKEGGYLKSHFERMSAFTQHRYFAFMSYLNDVEEGGETVFPYFDLR
jgi:hypothetical protein